ncbi:hypothetical protein CCR75_005527 [Bremia lactucae]|uniref:Uncharacterized protein n=1 Tax=Bremia lactucae TaxID=4779 RepID=A0A976IC01_BRELC|nr:hypothetical protein CCR75_005527 [Bremia lactucae]
MANSRVNISALAVAVFFYFTDAHNNMITPPGTYPKNFYNKNNPTGIIDPKVLPLPAGMTYNAGADTNTDAYFKAFNQSKYKTLRDFAFATEKPVDGATKECGFALIDGDPQELPEMVEWDGFDTMHYGPCEVWCDDVLAFSNWNCAVTFKERPARLPYDKSKCEGASVLASHWIALHTTPWQIYTACAPLKGASPKKAGKPTADTPETDDTLQINTSEAYTPDADTSEVDEPPEADTPEAESPEEDIPAVETQETSTDAPANTDAGKIDTSTYDTGGDSAADIPDAPPPDPATYKCSVRLRQR